MYVCICTGTTENHIQQAVEQGAQTMEDLHNHLGVGGGCGRCTHCAKQCLTSALSMQITKNVA